MISDRDRTHRKLKRCRMALEARCWMATRGRFLGGEPDGDATNPRWPDRKARSNATTEPHAAGSVSGSTAAPPTSPRPVPWSPSGPGSLAGERVAEDGGVPF